MKRIIALLVALMLILTGCSTPNFDFDGGNQSDEIVNAGDSDSSPEDSGTDDQESSSPENNQPENNQPENNQPENNQPENNQPENNQPENNQPENNQPENNQPENNQPENDQPDTPEVTHNYVATVTEPTCEKAGYTTYTCSDCGDAYTADQVPALSHNYNSSVTAPTCEKEGYTTYTCTICGTYYVAENVDAIGHAWVDATTSAPKTCTTCGATEGEKLPEDNTDSDNTSTAYGETLYINYIDVGQGDSIFIKVGDCDILIDAGKPSYGTTVSNYLNNQGVDDIELVINTHPDEDHYGGLATVFSNFVVEEIWISSYNKTTTSYANFTAAIKSEGLTAKKPSVGTVFTYEYLTLTVLYHSVGSDSNNSSIVCMLEYGSYKFLFTGDIGEEVESQLVSSGKDLTCDVLKVGHHGSKYSSSASFLNATGAKYGVISVGAGNTYGHPTSEALSRLSSAGISVYRTDLSGNIVFSTNGATMTLPGGSTVSGGSGSGTIGGGSSSGSSGSSSGSSSDSTQYFIGNTETKVFHLPTCSNLPAASKQNSMYNYWWIINIAGYTPCGRCLKDYVPDSSSGTSYIANTESKVYHLSTCSYLPAASKQTVITNTAGYTPCGHCISNSGTTKYIANTESKIYHLPTCSNLPDASKQEVIYDTSGYTACKRCLG